MRRIIWTLWALYGAALAAMVTIADLGWLKPLHNYHQTLVWLTSEAAQARIGGLLAAGRTEDALAFLRLLDLSLYVILFAVLCGITQALAATSPLPQRPRETHYVLGLLGVMIMFSPTTSAWLASLSQGPFQPLYTATPAYWLATMALSALLIARYVAFGAHDLVLAARVRLNAPQPGMTAAE